MLIFDVTNKIIFVFLFRLTFGFFRIALGINQSNKFTKGPAIAMLAAAIGSDVARPA